jgi:signal peptidase
MVNYKEFFGYIAIIIVGIIFAQHMNVVVSGSMEPTLHRGDIVLVDHNVDNVQVGDIIVYYGTWTPTPEDIIHRVIQKEQTHGNGAVYTTKGDNSFTNPYPDPVKVQQKQIISKVISISDHPIIIPKIGYITLIIRGL